MASGHSPSCEEIDGEVGGRVVVGSTFDFEDNNDCVGGKTRDSKSNRGSDKIPTPMIYRVDVTVCMCLRCCHNLVICKLSLTFIITKMYVLRDLNLIKSYLSIVVIKGTEPKLTTIDRYPLYPGLVHFLFLLRICLCLIDIYRCYESCSSQNVVLHLMYKHGRNKLVTTFRCFML